MVFELGKDKGEGEERETLKYLGKDREGVRELRKWRKEGRVRVRKEEEEGGW